MERRFDPFFSPKLNRKVPRPNLLPPKHPPRLTSLDLHPSSSSLCLQSLCRLLSVEGCAISPSADSIGGFLPGIRACIAIKMRTPNAMLSRGAALMRRPQTVYRLTDAARYVWILAIASYMSIDTNIMLEYLDPLSLPLPDTTHPNVRVSPYLPIDDKDAYERIFSIPSSHNHQHACIVSYNDCWKHWILAEEGR